MCLVPAESIETRLLAALAAEPPPASAEEILGMLSADGVCSICFTDVLRRLLRQGRVRAKDPASAALPIAPAELRRLAFILSAAGDSGHRTIDGGRFWIPAENLKTPLGRGLGGTVFLGKQVSLGRLVAIKQMNLARASHSIPMEQQRARFVREARVLAQLQHPHIVQVIAFVEEDPSYYTIMEYVPGGTFAEKVEREGPLHPAAVLDFMIHMVDALRYAQGKNILHRDVKPANVFVSGIKLTDFGLARVARAPGEVKDERELTQEKLILGTPQYMAPEQAEGDKDADFRADQYSLAATAYYMATGKYLYDDVDPKDGRDLLKWLYYQKEKEPVGLLERRPDFPRPLAEVIHKMLQKPPADRYPTYAAGAADLKNLVPKIPRGSSKIILPVAGTGRIVPPRPPAAPIPLGMGPGPAGASTLIRGMMSDLTTEKARLEAEAYHRYGAIGTYPEFLNIHYALAKECGAFDLFAQVWAKHLGVESVPDFETRYLTQMTALAHGQDAAGEGDRIPLDAFAYLTLAIRQAQAGKDTGDVDARPAEGIIRFLADTLDDPALAPFRIPASEAPAEEPVRSPTVALAPVEAPEESAVPLPKAKTTIVPPPAPPTGPWPLGEELQDNFTLEDELGQGGMATVYQGHDKALNRTVAIKVIEQKLFDVNDAADRFLREARMAAKLEPHNNVVPVYHAGKHDPKDGKHAPLFFIVMQLVKGKTLTHILSAKKTFPTREALLIARQIASGLAHAHAASLIHRDIKPDNVMLDERGVVKIMDFGLMRSTQPAHQEAITEQGVIVATLQYASPEQVKEQPLDVRTDLYSLGVVLYELLSGRRPYISATQTGYLRLIPDPNTQPQRLRTLVEGLPTEVDGLVHKMIEKEPQDRIQTADEVIARINAILARLDENGRSRRKFRLAPVAAALAIMAAAAGILWAAWPKKKAATPAETHEIAHGNETPPKKNPDETPKESDTKPQYDPSATKKEEPPTKRVEEPKTEVVDERPPLKTPPGGSVEEYMRSYAPTPDEISLLRAERSRLEARESEIQGHRYDGATADLTRAGQDPRQTLYTSILIDADLRRLSRLADLWKNFLERSPRGAKIDLVLAENHRTVSGTVLSVTGEKIQLIGDGDRPVDLFFKELADDTFLGRAEDLDALYWRATHGDPQAALADLRSRLGLALLRGHLPGIVHALILRAVASLDGLDATGAAAVLEGLDALKKTLPENLYFVFEPRALLEYEIGAAAAFVQKDFAGLFTKFERSRFAPRAAREILEDFQKKLLPGDLVGQVEFVDSWARDTGEAPGGKITYEDKTSERPLERYRFVTQESNHRAWLKRPFAGAAQGWQVHFVFEKDTEKTSLFEVTLSASSWIRLTPEGLSLWSAPKGTATSLGSKSFERPVAGADVAVIPQPGLTLVYVDGRLLLALSSKDHPLREGIMLGAGGTVEIESIRVVNRD